MWAGDVVLKYECTQYPNQERGALWHKRAGELRARARGERHTFTPFSSCHIGLFLSFSWGERGSYACTCGGWRWRQNFNFLFQSITSHRGESEFFLIDALIKISTEAFPLPLIEFIWKKYEIIAKGRTQIHMYIANSLNHDRIFSFHLPSEQELLYFMVHNTLPP
jgi:hypothetical protein